MILFINPFDRHRCLSKCLINISPSKAERSSPSRSTKLKVTLQDVYFEANKKKTLIVDSRSARDLRLVCLFYL